MQFNNNIINIGWYQLSEALCMKECFEIWILKDILKYWHVNSKVW